MKIERFKEMSIVGQQLKEIRALGDKIEIETTGGTLTLVGESPTDFGRFRVAYSIINPPSYRGLQWAVNRKDSFVMIGTTMQMLYVPVPSDFKLQTSLIGGEMKEFERHY